MSELGEGAGVLRELVVKLGFDVDEKKFEHFEKQIETIKVGLEGLVVAWHVAVLGAFELAREAAEVGDELDSQAAALGISTDALQKYSYAAEVSNVSNEAFTMGLQHLSQQLGEAARAAGPSRQLFQRLGISFSDGAGHARGMEDVLNDVSVVMAKTENVATRNSYAMELFGRSGARMGAFLAKPKAEIEALAKDITEFGFFDEERLRQVDAGDKAFKGFFAILRGIKTELGLQLLPAVTRVIDKFREWVHANADLIHQKLELYAQRIANFIEWGARVGLKLVHVVRDLVTMLGGLGNTVNLLGVAFLALFGARLLTSLDAVLKGFKLLAAFGGILDLEFLGIAAGIAALILTIQDLYVWMKGGDSVTGELIGSFEDFKKQHWFGGLIDDLALIKQDFTDIKNVAVDFLNVLHDLHQGNVKGALADLHHMAGSALPLPGEQSAADQQARAAAISRTFGDYNPDAGVPGWVSKVGRWLNPAYDQVAAGSRAPSSGMVPAAGRPSFAPSFVPSTGPSYSPPGTPSAAAAGPTINNKFDNTFVFPQGTPEDHAEKFMRIIDERLETHIIHSVQQSAARAN